MAYDLVRLVALDWPATREALRRAGADFYWDAGADDLEIHLEAIPSVATYDGPLARCPGRRDPEAGELYARLRPHLAEVARSTCDACFARLFWDDGAASLHADAEGDLSEVWNVLAPATVAEVLESLPALPWAALARAAEKAGPWDGRYLPRVSDLEGHVANHEAFLSHARQRGAGVLALISA